MLLSLYLYDLDLETRVVLEIRFVDEWVLPVHK